MLGQVTPESCATCAYTDPLYAGWWRQGGEPEDAVAKNLLVDAAWDYLEETLGIDREAWMTWGMGFLYVSDTSWANLKRIYYL